jgi:hypothetical protein
VKVDLARDPIVETAVMQTTMIKDSMTAYSTAVGPSSLFRNRLIFDAKFFIIHSVGIYCPSNTVKHYLSYRTVSLTLVIGSVPITSPRYSGERSTRDAHRNIEHPSRGANFSKVEN